MQEIKGNEHNWKLEDIFKNQNEFEVGKEELKKLLEKIKTYQGKVCETSDNLYNCYVLYEQALEKFDKIYAYGMLKYHLDMSNQESIKLFKEVETIRTRI